MTDSNLITLAVIIGIDLFVLGFILGGNFVLRYRDNH
jgi:uncharacterized membrane protein (DUF485 family)